MYSDLNITDTNIGENSFDDSLEGGGQNSGENANDTDPTFLLGIQLSEKIGYWEAVFTILILSCLIIVTVVGNILVILSVLTHNPLKILSNYFVVSLAVADLTVALGVLPLNIAYLVTDRWIFGSVTCKMWLTADVLCCTASILNLCAIALDRYWAIHDPIHYATQRTAGKVYFMIFLVWLFSCIICSPPLLGWNDWPDQFTPETPCALTTQKAYIVYSSLGSFFIPLILIVFIYFKIFLTQKKVADKRQNIKTTGSSTGSDGEKQIKKINKVEMELLNNESDTKTAQKENNIMTEDDATKKEKKKKRKHILAVVKEKNSIMYQKSIKAGSQSGIGPWNGSNSNSMCEEEKMNEIKENNFNNKDHIEENGTKDMNNGENSFNQNNLCQHHSKLLNEVKKETCNKSLMVEEDTSPSSSDACVGEKEKSNFFKSKPKVQSSVESRVKRKEKGSGGSSREQKAARTMAVIVVTFVVCWLPFFTMYVTLPFCGESCQISPKIESFITWLGYLNSTLNPIIYTIFNPYFRKAFRNILSCKK